jgi:HAE1 family hydrophobic/amphiphilic exporter-1
VWLTRFAINRPVITAMLFISLAIFGVMSYFALGVSLFPNVEFPFVAIEASYPGASPSEMEKLVLKPLEDQLNGMENLEQLRANAQEGSAFIFCKFKLDTDLNYETIDVQRRTDTARIYMPSDLDPPVVTKFTTSSDPVMSIAVSSRKLSAAQLSDLITQHVVPDYKGVPGILNVQTAGDTPREIHVYPDPNRLRAANATFGDLASALALNNANLPGGRMDAPTVETTVSVHADIVQPQDILRIPLPVPNGAQKNLTIGDVAAVEDGQVEQRLPSRYNSAPSILLEIQKEITADEVKTTQSAREETKKIAKEYPDVKFTEIEANADYTKASVNGVLQSLFEGILLTAVVMLLFLHAWRNAAVVMIAIPSSLLATFVVMRLLGFTIDLISMMGLGLTIGILVDDSIVVLENITRHRDAGETPMEAAYNGRTEIGNAALAITLVDVVVFLPIAFLSGIVGKYMKEFGLVIVVATLFSLFVSFTLTPLLAGRWSVKRRSEGVPGWARWFQNAFEAVARFYHERALPWALTHRLFIPFACGLLVVDSFTLVAKPQFALVINAGVALLLIVVMGLAKLLRATGRFEEREAPKGSNGSRGLLGGTALRVRSAVRFVASRHRALLGAAVFAVLVALPFAPLAPIGSEFVPASSTGVLRGSISYPIGTPITTTIVGMGRLERELLKLRYVESVLSSVGSKDVGPSTFTGGNYAQFTVILDKRHRRDTDTTLAGARDLDWTVPGAKYQIATEGGGGGGAPIFFTLTGPDAQLNAGAEKLAAFVRAQPGTINVSTSAESQGPRLNIRVDPIRASVLGVAPGDAATAARGSVGGLIPTKVRLDSGLTDVRLEFPIAARNDLAQIESVRVRAADGTMVPLAQVADFTLTKAPSRIERQDRARVVRVLGDIDPNTGISLGQILAPITKALATPGFLPPGVRASSDDGDSQLYAETFSSMGFALVTSFALVYMLMVVLYGSFLEPFVVMFSVPVAIVGALSFLAVRHQTLNLFSLIAIVMLFGLVAKNGILLVDYANQQRKKFGLNVFDAMQAAANTRFRPILMTTFAMIFGMLPLSLGLTEGAEARASMGTVLIGGLLSSLVLTLALVPVMYTYIMGYVDERKRRRDAKGALDAEQVLPDFERIVVGAPGD